MLNAMDSFHKLLQGRMAIPLSPRAVWKFTGADRVRYLNGQVTNDVAKLPAGHALHAAVCNAKGKMEGDVWISATADALWLDAPLELRESLGPRLERFIIADEVVMEDLSESVSGFHILAATGVADPSAISSQRFGQPGFDFWNPGPLKTDLPLASPPLVEALRIRQGLPLWGHEMSPHTLPPEAAMDRDAISYSKGCYIGQEVIARIKSKGHVNKKLARVAGDGNAPGALPLPLIQNGKEGGTLTSACFDPEGPGWIGLGIVKTEWAELGASFPLDDQTITVNPL